MATETIPFDPQKTAALLIGSWECHRERPLAGGEKGVVRRAEVATRKTNIKTVTVKDGDGTLRMSRDAEWVENDLRVMKDLLNNKNIQDVETYDYREVYDDGIAALGSVAVQSKIENFFRKRDKSHFIIYYSGHAFPDGSWAFSRVTRDEEQAGAAGFEQPTQEQGGEQTGATGVGPSTQEQGGEQTGATGVGPSTQEQGGEQTGATGVGPSTQEQGEQTGATGVGQAEEIVRQDDLIQSILVTEKRKQPEKVKKWNEEVKYEDIINLWVQNKGSSNRQLMMIIDSCNSGQWVRLVDGLDIVGGEEGEERQAGQKRNDICIQAACRAGEASMVADAQDGSIFTKAFSNVHKWGLLRKMFYTFIDQAFVLNITSLYMSPPRKYSFVPTCTVNQPFEGFTFVNSFDDVYLKT